MTLYYYIMPTKKQITINTRLNEADHKQMREKADTYFGGNMSALIRCAALKYSEEVAHSEPNSNLIDVMNAALKQIRKIGTNHNQAVKCINEKMKMSPLAFLPSDLLPFNEFTEGMKTVEDMLRYLYNMIKE